MNNALRLGKVFFTPDVRVEEPQQVELDVDGEIVLKEGDMSQVMDIS